MKKLIRIMIIIVFFLTLTFVIKYSRTTEEVKVEVDTKSYKIIENFFMENMLSSEFGVYTNYKENEIVDDDITRGHYILSESQGLLLEYAIAIDDKELFLSTWQFLESYMINEDGGFVWRVTPDYTKPNEVTATIDDLHIMLQLIMAQQKWSSMSEEFNKYIEIFLSNFENYVYWGHLINGYDLSTKEQMLELESCYLHFLSLENLKKYSDNQDISSVYDNGNAVLKGMYISDEMPFTYKRFYVETQMIEHTTDINMIEALLTALHLSQVNKLNKETKKWIEYNIDTGIFGYYNTNGNPISNMESSAIYGIIAQIAYYEKDEILYNKALSKGTDLLIKAIENPQEEEILSYDCLQLLIAYGLGLKVE